MIHSKRLGRRSNRRSLVLLDLLERRVLLSGSNFYVTTALGTGATDMITEYSASGSPLQTIHVGFDGADGIAVSAPDLFITNIDGNSIGEFTTSGAKVAEPLATNAQLLYPEGIVESGNDLFVTSYGPAEAMGAQGSIGEYTTSGDTVNAALVPNLNQPAGIAVSGSDLFVASPATGTIGEYTTAGDMVNPALISDPNGPSAIAISGSDLFVANTTNGTIAQYTTAGTMVSPALITGLTNPSGIAVSGTELLVVNLPTDSNGVVLQNKGSVGEYTTSGTKVNASLISGLTDADGIAFSGDSTSVSSSLTPTFGNVKLAAAALAGGKLNAKAPVVLTNAGSAIKESVTINLFADTGTSLDGNQVMIAPPLVKTVSLKAGQAKSFNFGVKSLPPTLPDGTYHILAQVVDPTGASSVTTTSQTVQVAAAFIQPTVTAGAVAPTSIAVNKSGSISVTVTNAGNVTASGVVITLNPSSDGVTPLAGVILERLNSGAKILPSKSKPFKLHFKVTGADIAGSYFPNLTVSLQGVSTTEIGTTPFTIS